MVQHDLSSTQARYSTYADLHKRDIPSPPFSSMRQCDQDGSCLGNQLNNSLFLNESKSDQIFSRTRLILPLCTRTEDRPQALLHAMAVFEQGLRAHRSQFFTYLCILVRNILRSYIALWLSFSKDVEAHRGQFFAYLCVLVRRIRRNCIALLCVFISPFDGGESSNYCR